MLHFTGLEWSVHNLPGEIRMCTHENIQTHSAYTRYSRISLFIFVVGAAAAAAVSMMSVVVEMLLYFKSTRRHDDTSSKWCLRVHMQFFLYLRSFGYAAVAACTDSRSSCHLRNRDLTTFLHFLSLVAPQDDLCHFCLIFNRYVYVKYTCIEK